MSTTAATFVTLESPTGPSRIDVPRLRHDAKQPALRRDQDDAERTLRLALRLCALASKLRVEGDDIHASVVEDTLTEYLSAAPPVRVSLAAEALDIPAKVVQKLIAADVLQGVEGPVQRVTAASVINIWPVVAALRVAGRSRNLVAALQSRLDNEDVWASRDFQKSLAQMHRGERGEWPEDF